VHFPRNENQCSKETEAGSSISLPPFAIRQLPNVPVRKSVHREPVIAAHRPFRNLSFCESPHGRDVIDANSKWRGHHRVQRRRGSTTSSLSPVLTTTTLRRKESASACARSSVSVSSRGSADTCVSDFVALAIARNLMQQFRLSHRLPYLRAAVGACIGEVDLRHAPMRCGVLDVHRQAFAAWASHEGWFGVVMADIGWHVGSPKRHSALVPDPKTSIRLCGCHNYDVWRTQGERPRIPSVCDKSARPDPSAIIAAMQRESP
jgi:hypothetical protein